MRLVNVIVNLNRIPWVWPRRGWAGALGAALCLNACAWLDLKQRELVYRPTPGVLADWQAISPQDTPLWLDQPAAKGHRLRALWIPQADPSAPVVLYLHGTFRNLFQNGPKIRPIHNAGFSVLAVDYRGWGESTPITPSESSIMADAEVAWEALRSLAPHAQHRVIYGHSMGSGVAVELAQRHGTPPRYGALVLEAAFTSMPDVAQDHSLLASVLAGWLSDEQFASIDKIGHITPPKWILTGDQDRTVPTHHSLRLCQAAQPPCTLVVFPGGSHSRLHSEFPERYAAVWQTIRQALNATPPAAQHPSGRSSPP